MYYIEDTDQLIIEDSTMPFGGKLDPKNRWVRLAGIMPWDHIEEIYLRTMNTETGRRALPSRMAFGSIYIKESEKLTDEGCLTVIQENPYMQYFLGLHEFQQAPLFDPSMMVHFRKRFPVEEVARINEYVCTGKWPEDGMWIAMTVSPQIYLTRHPMTTMTRMITSLPAGSRPEGKRILTHPKRRSAGKRRIAAS